MLTVSSMASRSVRLLLGFLLAGPALAVVFVPREARAQAVTVNPLIVRQRPDGTSYPLRAANLKPEAINFQDCEDDINLVFNLLITMGLGVCVPKVQLGYGGCHQPLVPLPVPMTHQPDGLAYEYAGFGMGFWRWMRRAKPTLL